MALTMGKPLCDVGETTPFRKPSALSRAGIADCGRPVTSSIVISTLEIRAAPRQRERVYFAVSAVIVTPVIVNITLVVARARPDE